MSLAPWFLNTPTKAHKPQQNLKIQHCQDTPPSLQQCKLIFLCSFLTVSFVGLKKKPLSFLGKSIHFTSALWGLFPQISALPWSH